MCFSFFYKHWRPQTEICYLTGMLSVNIQSNNQRKHVAALNVKTIEVLLRERKWNGRAVKRDEIKPGWCALILDLGPSWSIYQVINSISLSCSHLSSFHSHCSSYIQAQKTAFVVSPSPISSPRSIFITILFLTLNSDPLATLLEFTPWLPMTTRILSRLCGVALRALGNLSLSACLSYHASPHSLSTRNTWSVARVSQTCHVLSTSMPLQTLFPLPGRASIPVSQDLLIVQDSVPMLLPREASPDPATSTWEATFHYRHLPGKAVMRTALEATCKTLSTACSGHHELDRVCVGWGVANLPKPHFNIH